MSPRATHSPELAADGASSLRVVSSGELDGSRRAKLSAILEVHCAPGYNAACDMLTRAGWRDDFAMDGCLYPIARDPETGGRQLEELAFEVVMSESLALAAKKAATLRARGVRRVFAIDVERGVGLEWSVALGGWEMLGEDAAIEDRALFPALLVSDLVSRGSSDDAVARALLAKGNPVILEAIAAWHARAREGGRAERAADPRALRKYVSSCPSGFGDGVRMIDQAQVLRDLLAWPEWRRGAREWAGRFLAARGPAARYLGTVPDDWWPAPRRAFANTMLWRRLVWLWSHLP